MSAPLDPAQDFEIEWRGIAIHIRHKPEWIAGTDHLEIRTTNPEWTPLPITETGYRSHFLDGEFLAECGGPVAYVTAWLEDTAQHIKWPEAHQLSLF